MMIRNILGNVARLFEGAPYRWGGARAWFPDGQPGGFDCSGFAIALLQAVELLPRGDWTAQQLFGMFRATHSPQPGDLCFYGTAKKIVHVTVFLGGDLCIGANGGGPRTRTFDDARGSGARVQIAKVGYRKDFVGFGDVTQQKETPARPIGGPR